MFYELVTAVESAGDIGKAGWYTMRCFRYRRLLISLKMWFILGLHQLRIRFCLFEQFRLRHLYLEVFIAIDQPTPE